MDERGQFVCLDRNERTVPYTRHEIDKIAGGVAWQDLCRYPDPSPLYRALSRSLNLLETNLYLTPGSDAAVRMLLQTYLRAGDRVLMADPTYAMYSIYTRIFQSTPCAIPYDPRLHLDLDLILNSIKTHPRVLILANPDQPTGAVLPSEALFQLATATREADILFIIDEAYYPFYPHTALDFVRQFDHIVILRTFSKAHGLAGLRLGYLAAHPDVVRHITRVRGAHEVNALAIKLGCRELEHPELSRHFISEIEAGRQVLEQTAKSLRLQCPVCPTNFQLLRFPGCSNTNPIVDGLKKKGYLVKGGFAFPAIRDCIRVTLAGPDIMSGFSQALTSVMEEITWKPLA